MAHVDHGNAVLSGQNGVFKPIDFDIDIGNDNEIFSSH